MNAELEKKHGVKECPTCQRPYRINGDISRKLRGGLRFFFALGEGGNLSE